MRCTILGILIGFSTLAGVATAQIPAAPNGCSKCVVVGYLDLPASNRVVSNSAGWFIGGWAFLCESGKSPDRVDVFYRSDGGFGVPVKNVKLYPALPRPDVSAAYGSGCPAVLGSPVGFHAYVGQEIPPGTRDVWINVWVGPYMGQHALHLTITN